MIRVVVIGIGTDLRTVPMGHRRFGLRRFPVADFQARQLCSELRRRFGAVGKTERVFAIWREEVGAAVKASIPVTDLEAECGELRERVVIAEAAAAENLARAERAELREQAHQDKWAMEIDRLRMEAKARPNHARELRDLQATVVRLTVELHAAREVGRQQPS